MNKTIKTKKQLLSEHWSIDTDFLNDGKEKNYQNTPTASAIPADVPSTIQEWFPEYYGVAWYWCRFNCTLVPQESDRIFLRFGAADYKAEVWINGTYLGEYEGGETSFEFDVTDHLRLHTENLLAVRIINPCGREIDGLTITNTPNRNKRIALVSGHSINYGGLLGGVELILRKKAAITDIFVIGEIHTGKVSVKVTFLNQSKNTEKAEINLLIKEKGGTGSLVSGMSDTLELPSGLSERDFVLTVENPQRWELDDPNLYGICCTINTSFGISSESVRFGFRDFRIKDGFFYINDKRIFLKCAHTGNVSPIGIGYPKIKDFKRRDFINAKASGFNAVRCIAAMLRPEQLDFCDEIGLMVIDECYAGWMLGVDINPETPTPADDPESYLYRFDLCTENMIRQDRNHACIAAYEFLNETGDGPVFRRAVACLAKARALDPSRLIMLSSGRFDNDYTIGCAANPYEGEWKKVWGADSKSEIEGIHDIGPSLIGAGDVHCYPCVPHDEHTYDYLMKIGTGMRPVFLSEYGIGTCFHVIHEANMFEQHGANLELCDYKWVKKQSDDLKRDFSRFGFDRVYPYPETMLNESLRLGARQRSLGFNMIRSNPQICGFSMTGLLDHGMCGEGLWTYWRRWKPEMFDAISDGFSPLRFCLMTYPTNAYSNRPFRVKASLATEDALTPGVYPASFCIIGECGIVWKKDADIVIPDSMPFAVTVFDEEITLDVPTGKYTLYANLNKGGSPTGEKLEFYITDERDIKSTNAFLYTWGVEDNVRAFLTSHGIKTAAYEGQTDAPVIIGNPADYSDENKWISLRKAMEQGQKTVYMQSRLFLDHKELAEKTGFEGNFDCVYTQDWLYHKEYVPMPHPIFEGIKPGMFDMDYIGSVFPHETIETQATPEPICSGFVTGNIWVEGAYRSSYSIAESKYGKGSVIVSMPYILENIGKNPIADLMLINTVRYISTKS